MTKNTFPNINRSKIHEELVQSLAVEKLNGAARSIFPTIRELLCFAAILGFSKSKRIPLDKSKGTEDVSYQQMERFGDDELIFLIAVAEENDAEILKIGVR
jgi:dnd system-associated protein 4